MITFFEDGSVKINMPKWGIKLRKRNWTKTEIDDITSGQLVEDIEWDRKDHPLYEYIDHIWRAVRV